MSLSAFAVQQDSASASEQYESLLLRLHALIAGGQGNSDAADALRAAMEEPESELTQEQMDRLDGLSADLYMLQGAEIFEASVKTNDGEPETARFVRAFDNSEWDAALSLLRSKSVALTFPDAQRARLRATAYESLGMFEAARLFKAFAAALGRRETFAGNDSPDILASLPEAGQLLNAA